MLAAVMWPSTLWVAPFLGSVERLTDRESSEPTGSTIHGFCLEFLPGLPSVRNCDLEAETNPLLP